MQTAAIKDKIQVLYKQGTARGIAWGLGIALLDVTMKASPIGPLYINMITSITTPLYSQLTEWTSNNPILLWLSNSVMTIMYLVLGYGVKITSSALIGFWTLFLQKITFK